jgi:hypothetical protein
LTGYFEAQDRAGHGHIQTFGGAVVGNGYPLINWNITLEPACLITKHQSNVTTEVDFGAVQALM